MIVSYIFYILELFIFSCYYKLYIYFKRLEEDKLMMNITYVLDNKLYLNITNKCPCSCIFCIRKNGDGAYGSDSLWLDHQPTKEEVIESLSKEDLDKYDEIIFCGFGEPTCELEILISAAKYLREHTKTPIRINTNGLTDLIHSKENTIERMKGLFDVVSISLNASTSEEYCRVTRPSYGQDAFYCMINFAKRAKELFPKVLLSVVDIIDEEEIEKCRKLCDSLGITLRVREFW